MGISGFVCIFMMRRDSLVVYLVTYRSVVVIAIFGLRVDVRFGMGHSVFGVGSGTWLGNYCGIHGS